MTGSGGIAGLSGIAGILHPDRIHPLQQPRAQVDIAGGVDPQSLAISGAGSAGMVAKIGDCLPQIGGEIQDFVPGDHVIMIFRVAWSGRKAVPFPIIDVKAGLIIDKAVFKILDVLA